MFSLFKSRVNKIKKAFSKTRLMLGDKLSKIFNKPIDNETLDELEQVLYEADLGTSLSLQFVEYVRSHAKKNESSADFIETMKDFATQILQKPPKIEHNKICSAPKVILVVGVNGTGKTTSCAKLAKHYKDKGNKVLLAAGDTFRAAAIEQLETWSNTLNIDCVKGKSGGDPSAVIFDALSAAKARGHDLVIADTAGRLQSKTELMRELAKINKVIQKFDPNGPHETFLVLDATTGQNAIDQAKTFNTFTPLTGLIVTKLDGSAKGGIILSIYHLLGIPIPFIGIGERAEDFIPFNIESYVDALFS